MDNETRKRWMALAGQVDGEKDMYKRFELVKEINDLIEGKTPLGNSAVN